MLVYESPFYDKHGEHLVICLNLGGDFESNGSFNIDLGVAFSGYSLNSILNSAQLNQISPSPLYHIGCKAADITLSIQQATIRKYTKKHENKNREISGSHSGNKVSWNVSLLPNHHQILNYLCETIPLLVNCSWHRLRVEGSIELKPIVYYFDKAGKQINKKHKTWIDYLLWKKEHDRCDDIFSINNKGYSFSILLINWPRN